MGKWYTTQLAVIANVNKGSTLTSAEMKEGEIPVVAGGMSCCGYHNIFNRKGNVRDCEIVCVNLLNAVK